MSLIGYVFNKILSKNIPVYIATSGNGYIRLSNLIDQSGDPHARPPSTARRINRIFLWCMGNESSYDRSEYFMQALWDMIIGLIE
ncbi:hypothetical protein PoHVEF18_007158 [Penicillium ochrochloron]